MKKFLALFLVLVFALSCVLVSCGKDDVDTDNTSATTEDDAWIAPSTTPTPTTTPAATTKPVVTTPAVTTGKPADSYTWTNDSVGSMVYVRIDALNVRKDTQMSESTIVGTAKFGDSFKRVKYNDQWTMISYNGKDCYVATAYITTDNGSVIFDKFNEEKTVYVNVDTTLNLRSSTYIKNPDGTTYDGNLLTSLKRGVKVVQTAVSKNGLWAKVKYTYTDAEGETTVYDGYCNTEYLSNIHPDDIEAPAITVKPVG